MKFISIFISILINTRHVSIKALEMDWDITMNNFRNVLCCCSFIGNGYWLYSAFRLEIDVSIFCCNMIRLMSLSVIGMSHSFFSTMFNFYHCTIYNFFATSKIKPDTAMKVQRLLNGMLHLFCVEIMDVYNSHKNRTAAFLLHKLWLETCWYCIYNFYCISMFFNVGKKMVICWTIDVTRN